MRRGHEPRGVRKHQEVERSSERKNSGFGALLPGRRVACGGSKSNPDAIVVVSDTPTTTVCDPVAQTGCNANEKCTWIRDVATASQQVGHLGCAPSLGTDVAVDAACTWGTAGATTGFDNCAKGLQCNASSTKDMAPGKCQTICDDTALDGAAGACTGKYACGLWHNYYANSTDTGNPKYGLCDPTCDPLTQKRDT